MRLFITGASGLLGSNIAFIAGSKGHVVLGTYNEHEVKIPGCKTAQVDLAGDLSTIKRFAPDCIIHCAAATNVDGCEKDHVLARKLNVDATGALVETARAMGKRLIFISTDSVYDGSSSFHKEDELPKPANYYAKTKVEAENMVKTLDNYAAARTNFYGFNIQNKKSFSEWLHAKFAAGEKITAFTDFHFSPIMANNLADAVLELAENKFVGTINLGGDGRVSKYQFALDYADAFGFDKSLVVPTKMADMKNLAAKRPHDTSMDISKAKKTLSTKLLNMEEGMAAYKKLYDDGYQNRLRAED